MQPCTQAMSRTANISHSSAATRQKQIELLRVELLVSEQRLAEPHADDMGDDQRGDAQAEHELQRLDRLPAELPALVQRPDAEPGMHEAAV